MAKQRRQRAKVPQPVRQDGALCVSFVNTASAKRRGIATLADLLAWAVQCGAVAAGEAAGLERAAAADPPAAAAVVRRGAEIHAVLQRILGALAAGRKPAAADLEALNREIQAALSHRRLVDAGDGYRWSWGPGAGPGLERLLWPVVLSASEILASKYHRRVRRCAGEGCGLLFVDRSPGAHRRWCSMRSCGGRVKSRRHYRRTVKPRRAAMDARIRALDEEYRRARSSGPSPPPARTEEEG